MTDGSPRPDPRGADPGSGDMHSLVVRAWLEPGTPPRLRARVVEIAPGLGERPVIVTTSIDEACLAVRSWFQTLQGIEQHQVR